MTRFSATFSIVFCLLLPQAGNAAAIDGSLLEGLKARAIGPAAVGGRIAAIDAVNDDPNHIVIGVATGGVWMSDNGGLTWEPVFDDQPVASIGALAINQSNPDIIWVGTGEGNVRNSTSIGGGIYKSLDGGRTWKLMGLPGSERINRIALHPTDPDIVYVAAMGALWGPNEERGVYKTNDGGETWSRILYVDENTGATDIKMDPTNPDKLFAGMWQFRRWPYFFKSGGPGSGMYVSHDGGETWRQRTEEDGLPKGELGRMAFSISASNPDRVYALVEAKASALLRSDDGGVKWTRVNEAHNIMDRPFYYTEIIADPQNPDRVYNMATRLRVSIDGGRNFEHIAAIDCCAAGNTIHIDNHAFWINPADPRHLIIGNDGGIAISRDRGDTWRFVRNLPLAQFYHVAVDDSDPYHVYGGLQDNGSFRGPAEIREQSGIRNLHWQEVGFGDGFDTRPDPENDRAGYGQSQGGFLYRYDLDTGLQQIIRPAPHGEDVDLRFNWNAGLAQDPFDPATIYYGSQYVHKSTDRGRSWTVISPDLTSNDPEMQTFRTSGGLTYDVTAAENYTSIVAIAPSTLQRDVLWVGSDDGRVHVTQDGGTSWTRIDERARGVPDGAWVPMIAPSPHDAGTAFVVFDDHRRSDMNPYVYRVTDFGRRWESLVTDELEGYALSVLQDHQDADLLFLGTEFGLFFSTNGGGEWTRFKAGVPTVSVMDMAIQARENDLVLGTHGRSIYVIDDYSALRNLGAEDFEARLKLLSVSDGQRYAAGFRASTRFTGAGEFRGANEPYGAMFTFLASGDDLPHPDEDRERDRLIGKRKAESSGEDGDDSVKTPSKPPRITVRISDTDGKAIRTFKRPVHQGINRVTWGMQADGVRPQPGPNRRSADDDLPPGPQVPPGMYTITLTLGEEEVSATARVLPDPRLDISQEQYEAGFAAQQELMKLNEASVTALERIDHARSDVTTVGALIGKHPDAAEDEGLKDLKKQAGEIGKKLDELEKRFRNLPKTRGVVYSGDKVGSRIGMAMYFAASAAGAPSPTAEAYAGIARRTLDEALSAVNEFLEEDLAAFREAVSAAGIGLLTPTDPVSVKQ